MRTPQQIDGEQVVYRERMWIPWWWWPIALALTALFGYELGLAIRSVSAWILMLAVLPVAVLVCLWIGRRQLVITHRPGTDPDAPEGTLHVVGRAHLPLSVIARTVAVPTSARQAALGRQLDPEAFVAQHGWIRPLVLIVLDDPDDPTPYWLIATRNPAQVIAALGSARAEQIDQPPAT